MTQKHAGKQTEELDIARVVETFIATSLADSHGLDAWQTYLRQLQFVVAPLVADLRAREQIRWFSFLLHGQESGVPTSSDDYQAYIHLRFEVAPEINIERLIHELPTECIFTRRMALPDLGTMGVADVEAFVNGDALVAWELLGKCSEWSLDVVMGHRRDTPVPPQNVAQLVHYMGNQLQLRMAGIPCP